MVSLVPSQTELLFDLGVGARVVGVTKFCIHPAAARQGATVIGGTKNFDLAKIEALRPDLIIGNKEENYREGIEALAAKFPVYVSDVADLPQALEMIRAVGQLVGAEAQAEKLALEIRQPFDGLANARPPGPPERVAYLIWRKPWMAVGYGTFIADMLARAGFDNVFGHLARYPEISAAQLAAAAPQRILLSSEPYPFRAKHFAEIQEICPQARVEVVDGELFSWYGSRLRHTATYLAALRTG